MARRREKGEGRERKTHLRSLLQVHRICALRHRHGTETTEGEQRELERKKERKKERRKRNLLDPCTYSYPYARPHTYPSMYLYPVLVRLPRVFQKRACICTCMYVCTCACIARVPTACTYFYPYPHDPCALYVVFVQRLHVFVTCTCICTCVCTMHIHARCIRIPPYTYIRELVYLQLSWNRYGLEPGPYRSTLSFRACKLASCMYRFRPAKWAELLPLACFPDCSSFPVLMMYSHLAMPALRHIIAPHYE
jgi:hypothetical protein